MAFHYNPKIVTDGLQLCLDAMNPKSYPGTGSEWYDLSGNNYHMSLKNSLGITNDGNLSYFSLNGSNHYGSCDGSISGSTSATVANLGIGGTHAKTVVCLSKMKSGVGNTLGGLFDLGDTGTAGGHFCLRRSNTTTGFRAQFWSTPDYDFTYADATDVWTMYSQVYGADKIGKTYGNDGELLGNDASAFDLVTAGSRPFEMGRYSGSYYVGADVVYYLVYNKALTTSEMKQNYIALRKRFGL